MESLFQSLWSNIKTNLHEWHKTKSNSDLYIILIANNRSVLFILQKNTVWTFYKIINIFYVLLNILLGHSY